LKADILLYLDVKISDSDLDFNGFIPEKMASIFSEIPKVENIFFSVPADYTGKLLDNPNCFIRESNDGVEFWKEIFKKTGSVHIVKIFADSPFADSDIIKEMIDLHLDSLAEFTYSENLPQGFTCDIISGELVDQLPETSEKTLPLGQVVRSNINQFDVELYYRAPDIREMRLSFRSGSERDRRVMENILNNRSDVPSYAELKGIIKNNPELVYTAPSYLEIELTGKSDHTCIFSYGSLIENAHGEMSTELFNKILHDMRTFSLPYNICLGGSGDPLMHPDFYKIIELAAKEKLVRTIVVETDGILADSNYKNFLLSSDGDIKTIINMNGMNSDTYLSIHGKDNFDAVFQNIISLRDLNEDTDRVYIQIMKINETNTFLDSYYDFWENNNVPIILQKQNTVLGRLEDRRYSDLSPLERTPCCHLQYDFYILSNGDVAFCKQDPDGEYSSGNLNNESLENIWKRREEFFMNNYRGNLSTAPDCRKCDEWYTFNL